VSSVNQSRAAGEYGRGGTKAKEAGKEGYACILDEGTGKVLKEFKTKGNHAVMAEKLKRAMEDEDEDEEDDFDEDEDEDLDFGDDDDDDDDDDDIDDRPMRGGGMKKGGGGGARGARGGQAKRAGGGGGGNMDADAQQCKQQ
jgi:hypothetical protein